MTRSRASCGWNRLASAAGAMGLALACSACATPGMAPPSARSLPQPGDRDAAFAAQPAAAPSGVVRLGRRTNSDIQQVAYAEAAGEPLCPPEAILRCPPEPRHPVAGPNPYAVGLPVWDQQFQPSPFHYPDEYLCDGGDRGFPVHYDEQYRQGLETEDTVAEFTDHSGKERVAKSNRVCVYAPRFAAVRTVSSPSEEGTLHKVAGVANADLGGEMRTRLALQQKQKNQATGGIDVRSRASGLEVEQVATDVGQRQRPQIHDKILNTFQDLNVLELSTVDQSAVARLNLGLHNAQVWSRELYPVIQAKVEKAEIGLSEVHASALVVVDDRRSDQPAQLRLLKVVDKDTAQPGDVLTFTIRYDNLGPNEAVDVRIVDNLTPRLEYVHDSAQCDREGRLVVEDNGEGSLVLTFEFAQPLPARAGGVVSFQARVR